MDLVERYLQAVKFFLPWRQQDDVVRELSENLYAQIEDREQELGRSLTDEEVANILRAHGHPMLVAGRYRSRQQLIGPALFSIYVVALQAGLVVALAVTVVTATIAALVNADPMPHLIGGALDFPRRALMVFAWTTLGFAALDFAQSKMKIGRHWDPRRLPKVVAREHRISRVESSVALIFTVAAAVLLLLIPNVPSLLLGPLAEYLTLAPAWEQFYVGLALLTVAAAFVHLVDLIRPHWTPGRSFSRIALHGAAFVLFALFLRAGEWVVARPDAALDGSTLERVVDVVNATCQVGLLVACAINLIAVLVDANRLRVRGKTSSHPPSAAPHTTRG
jgi:hypothetical protein